MLLTEIFGALLNLASVRGAAIGGVSDVFDAEPDRLAFSLSAGDIFIFRAAIAIGAGALFSPETRGQALRVL